MSISPPVFPLWGLLRGLRPAIGPLLLTVLLCGLAHAAFPPTEISRFENNMATLPNQWGASVAIDGDYAAIGAPGISEGRVLVYSKVRTPGQEDRWSLTTTLSSGQSGITGFGTTVAISGNIIAAATANYAGGISIFERSVTTGQWSRVRTYGNDNFEYFFGESLALRGDLLVAGRVVHSGQDLQGEARVYRRSPTTGWAQEAVLKGGIYKSDDGFGSSVDVQGDTVVVGAPALFSPTTNALGCVFVFGNRGSGWREVQRIEARSSAEMAIGHQLSLRGDRLAVGTHYAIDPVTRNQTGAIHIYQRPAWELAGWTHVEEIWPANLGPLSEVNMVRSLLTFDQDMITVAGTNQSLPKVYVLQRQLDAFGTTSWSPIAPALSGLNALTGGFSAGTLLLGDPQRVSISGIYNAGAFYFMRLSPHPDAPIFQTQPPSPAQVAEGVPFRYAVQAVKPSGIAGVTLMATGLPPWLTLTSTGDGAATLAGTPGAGDAGTHEITLDAFAAPDRLQSQQSFTLTVLPVSVPPVIAAFSAQSAGGDHPARLAWQVIGAESIRLLPDDLTLPTAQGVLDVSPTHSTTYVLETRNAAGVARAEVRVDVPVFGPALPISQKGQVVTATDYDGDGLPDIVGSTSGSQLFWQRNLGSTFTAPIILQTSSPTVSVVSRHLHLADFDQDGDLDLLLPVTYNMRYYRSLGEGGNYSAPTTLFDFYISNIGLDPVAVFDVDGDTLPDALFQVNGNLVWIKPSRGTFGALRTIRANFKVTDVVPADLDRDGKPDLVYTYWEGGSSLTRLGWLRNLGGGNFADPVDIDSPANDTQWVKVGDLDGDGWLDVLTTGPYRNEIAWRRNLAGAGFGPPVVISTLAKGPTDIVIADLDGDGDADVAIASRDDDEVSWFENLGAGRFGPQLVLASDIVQAGYLEAADLDGDGDLDLLARGVYNDLYWFKNLNDPPKAADLSPRSFVEDSQPADILLDAVFDDPQDLDATLTYTLLGTSGDPLFAAAALRADGRAVQLQLAPDAFGSALLHLRATDPRGLSVEVELPIVVTQQIDLHVSVQRDRPVASAPGAAVHTVTVRNLGPSDATAVVLEVASVLPPETAAGTPIASAGSYIDGLWSIPLLAENATATLELPFDLSAAAHGGIDVLATTAQVRSAGQSIVHPEDDSAAVATSLISPADVGIPQPEVSPILQRQSGLFVQQVTVTNRNPLPISGLRLVVGGLPLDVLMRNAGGVLPEGRPYLDSPLDLAPGESLTFTLEYYRPTRRMDFTPLYSIEAVFVQDLPQPAIAAAAPQPERSLALADGAFLLEFASVPGGQYAIEYSADLATWHRVTPTLTARANRTQWIDQGPPQTASHPAQAGARYYRIVTLPE